MHFFGTPKRMERMMDIWKDESNMPPFYHDLPYLSSRLGLSTPPIDDVMERIREIGYSVSRTHFSPTGIKTDAPIEDVYRILKGRTK